MSIFLFALLILVHATQLAMFYSIDFSISSLKDKFIQEPWIQICSYEFKDITYYTEYFGPSAIISNTLHFCFVLDYFSEFWIGLSTLNLAPFTITSLNALTSFWILTFSFQSRIIVLDMSIDWTLLASARNFDFMQKISIIF